MSPSTTAGGRRSCGRRELFDGGSEEEFRAGLYAPEMHDPELLIRTGGERRFSNYLLWQLAETELLFSEELWPEFSRSSLEAAIEEFRERRRRRADQEEAAGRSAVRESGEALPGH